ncbi:MAG: hypothetical protein HUU16_17185 [Candidatus Omnitrophica bacterium]|nr:hypothetical protein [Candidatus Omnitrophota bacterium]
MRPRGVARAAFYIDSHGFGHSTRSMALIEAFPPDWDFLLRSNAPDWLFEKELHRPHKQFPSPLDIHPKHSTGYRIDPAATRHAAARKVAEADNLLASEADWLREEGVDLVLSDISPLAIAAARRAGLPAYGVSNFTWDWIFEPLFVGFGPDGVVQTLREMMGEATANFRLPFSDPGTFPFGSVESPLLVRHPRKPREAAREEYGFEAEVRYFVVTFGGIEREIPNLPRLKDFEPLQFVRVARPGELSPGLAKKELIRHPLARNFWILHAPDLYHPDLVLAADGVVTKPGYGILSECMATATPILLDSREDFREFEVVKRVVANYPQVAVLESRKVEELDLGEALEKVLASPPRPWRGGVDGAEFIAERIVRGTD